MKEREGESEGRVRERKRRRLGIEGGREAWQLKERDNGV